MTSLPPPSFHEWIDPDAEGIELKPDAPEWAKEAFERWNKEYDDLNKS